MATKDKYVSVTELPGQGASNEQLARLYCRYKFASQFCEGKDVLEVACGCGQGLGYLAKNAKMVVGVDIDKKLLEIANKHYKGRDNIQLKWADAHQLIFADNSFDVMILYEAIYYLAYPEKFISETQRILRKEGILLICSANKDWSGFNSSPYSHKYFSAPELFNLLKQNGFINIRLYGDCPAKDKTTKDKIISYLKRMAVALHLIPKTMKGKEFLKRIFLGRLLTLPAELEDGMAEYCEPVPISNSFPNHLYKVLFAAAYA